MFCWLQIFQSPRLWTFVQVGHGGVAQTNRRCRVVLGKAGSIEHWERHQDSSSRKQVFLQWNCWFHSLLRVLRMLLILIACHDYCCSLSQGSLWKTYPDPQWTTNFSKGYKLVSSVRYMVSRLVDCTMLLIWKVFNSSVPSNDLVNDALQCLILFAKQHTIPLQIFARDGSNCWILMDREQQNPAKLFGFTCWYLLLKVRGNIDPMFPKPSGHYHH